MVCHTSLYVVCGFLHTTIRSTRAAAACRVPRQKQISQRQADVHQFLTFPPSLVPGTCVLCIRVMPFSSVPTRKMSTREIAGRTFFAIENCYYYCCTVVAKAGTAETSVLTYLPSKRPPYGAPVLYRLCVDSRQEFMWDDNTHQVEQYRLSFSGIPHEFSASPPERPPRAPNTLACRYTRRLSARWEDLIARRDD